MIVWNVERDNESFSCETTEDMHTIWDNMGNPYVVTPDGLTFTQDSSCMIKCFSVSEYFKKNTIYLF